MYDPGGHLQIILLLQGPFGFCQRFQQGVTGQALRIEMHLQGTDARGQLNHAVEVLFFQPQHQRIRPEAQTQVQHQRAVFHQQVAITGGAVDHIHAHFLL